MIAFPPPRCTACFFGGQGLALLILVRAVCRVEPVKDDVPSALGIDRRLDDDPFGVLRKFAQPFGCGKVAGAVSRVVELSFHPAEVGAGHRLRPEKPVIYVFVLVVETIPGRIEQRFDEVRADFARHDPLAVFRQVGAETAQIDRRHRGVERSPFAEPCGFLGAGFVGDAVRAHDLVHVIPLASVDAQLTQAAVAGFQQIFHFGFVVSVQVRNRSSGRCGGTIRSSHIAVARSSSYCGRGGGFRRPRSGVTSVSSARPDGKNRPVQGRDSGSRTPRG